MKNRNIIFAGIIFSIALLTGCKKEDPVVNPPTPQNEEELITTFKITFIDPAGINPSYTATFKDIDGPGGNDPSIFDTIILKPNATYQATISFLNEASVPVTDITAEILEEAKDHLICFDITGASISVVRTDSDGTYEVGLSSNWVTGNASVGSSKITLRHQPGIKNGTCALGDSDIELNFVTKVQ